MPSLYDFATWDPLLRLVRAGNAERFSSPGGYVAGHVGRGMWSVPLPRPRSQPRRALQVNDMREEFDAVDLVRDALEDVGFEEVASTEVVYEFPLVTGVSS